jgi:Na+/glutamate symporter
MTPEDHDRLEDWAKKYAILGLCGFLSVLLLLGKGLHYLSLYRGVVCRVATIPPSILSGIVGLFWMGIMKYVDATLINDLDIGLESFKLTMVNFMFASLTLGLFCSRSSSKHSNFKAIFLSILHEGIPMVIYSQILIWGQSSICLLVYTLVYLNSPQVPHLVSAMVPLGIEVGDDVIPTAVYKNIWSQTVVQEAETLGLFASCLLGVLALTVKNRYIKGPWNDSQNRITGRNDFYLRGHTSSADSEAFGRMKSEGSTSPTSSVTAGGGGGSTRSLSSSIPPSLSQRITSSSSGGGGGGGSSVNSSGASTSLSLLNIPNPNTQDKPFSLYNNRHQIPSPSASPTHLHRHLPKSHINSRTTDSSSSSHSSLGTHLSLIFIAVFLAFCFGLFSRIFESQSSWLKSHRILSSIRMFELAIIFSFLLIHFFLSQTKLHFKSEWFMRLCGLALDMVVTASLTSALPKPASVEQVQYGLVGVFVCVCTLWNLFIFIFLGRKMFPNFWFERGVILSCEALGHSSIGLLFTRALDPSMNTPVPFSYVCKLMLFAIFPSSGGKNTIVVSLVVSHGPWIALMVCCCVVVAWGFIFEKCIRGKYLGSGGAGDVATASAAAAANSSLGGGGYGALVRSRSESDLFRESSPFVVDASSSCNSARLSDDWHGNSLDSLRDLELTGTASGHSITPIGSLRELGQEEVLEFDDDLLQMKEAVTAGSIVPLLSSTVSGGIATTTATSTTSLPLTTGLGSTLSLPPSLPALPAFRMNSVSGMISPSHFSTIMSWILPEYQHSLIQLSLLYTLQRDGASLATLLSLCSSSSSHPSSLGTDDLFHSSLPHTSSSRHSHQQHHNHHNHQVIILIEDSWGYVFGAYLSHPLKVTPEYYGTGENFVFALLPQPSKYSWTGRNEYFVLSNFQQLVIGGGGNGYAIQLDDELNTGVSAMSETFMNPTLSSNEYFKCLNVEVWAIESAIGGGV